MGRRKDWLYYLSGGGGSKSSTTKRDKTSSNNKEMYHMREKTSTTTTTSDNSTSAAATSSGCITSLFQLFDFHHPFHFPNLHPHPPDSFVLNIPHEEEPKLFLPLKGVEAPRNSLDMDDQNGNFVQAARFSSSSSTMKKIRTSTGSSRTYHHDLSSSECSSSSPAGTKTPTLVARLMGLDLLPENSSPRPSSSSSSNHFSHSSSSTMPQHHRPRGQHCSKNSKKSDAMTECRSLPETPRVSSARKSDVDRRFSLQSNKENRSSISNDLVGRELEFSKFLATKIAANPNESNMSPGRYAKQIVKQFKESVNSRRVGRDITNTVNNNGANDEQRRDQHIVLLKSKKPTSTPDSCSPRLSNLLETKNKLPAVSRNTQISTSHSPKVLPLSPLSSPCTNTHTQPKCVTVSSRHKAHKLEEKQQKCRKNGGENFDPKLRRPLQSSGLIRNKQEDSFVRPSATNRAANVSDYKKCKKTPLSNHVPFLSVRKQACPPATKLLQKQEVQKQSEACAEVPRLPRTSSPSYTLPEQPIITVRDDINSNGTTTTFTTSTTRSTSTGRELEHYISAILKCTSSSEITDLPSRKCYSYFYPLKPSIFHHLQISFPNINHKKLMFDLVDELLVDILRPKSYFRPYEFWVKCSLTVDESQLVKILCERIQSFPSADCRVLEDIDALIDKDLDGKENSVSALVEGEGDEIVAEIECDILGMLVNESVAMVIFGGRTE